MEKMEKENIIRKENGEEPYTEVEWHAKIKADKEKEEEEKKSIKKGDEIPDPSKKPPTGLNKGSLDEMVKLGGRISPKGADKEGTRNKFASHMGAPT